MMISGNVESVYVGEKVERMSDFIDGYQGGKRHI